MSTKKIVLKSSDGESFEIDEAVALQSQTIAQLIEVDCADKEIPIVNVTGKILSIVIDYCKKHANLGSSTEEDIKKWDAEFMKIDQSIIFDLIMASSYLNVKSLLDLTCQTIADMITACKNADEVRTKFGIENDYTPEEEEQVRKENAWAFE